MDCQINYDNVNLKDLAKIVTDYMHANNINNLNNLRKFYSKLFDMISEDVKNSYLNRTLKYLSSTFPQVITIFDDFNDGIYDEEIMQFSSYIVKKTKENNNYHDFYENLNNRINFTFFENEEYIELNKYFNNEEYDKYIFVLLKHSFYNYKISLPGISGQRMYEEAMALSYNSENQRRAIKESALLDNPNALILYANYNYDTNLDLSIKCFLKSKKNMTSLWELGYILENRAISKESFLLIKKELKDYFIKDEFTKLIKVNKKTDKESMELAFKLYYYITKNSDYSKAYHSVGKLLMYDYVRYNNDRENSIEISKKYLINAIKLGNINSMFMIPEYYLNHLDISPYDKIFLIKMLKKSADLGEIDANLAYGKILKKEKKQDCKIYLKYAAERNNAEACYELAREYELEEEYEQAIKYYKKAIFLEYYDAVFDLCILYTELKDIYHKEAYIYKAQNLYKEYKDNLSEINQLKLENILY